MSTSLTELWASPHWREEAEAWIHDVLAARDIAVTGPIRQPRIRFWSTQLTVPTDHGLVWFKENNPGERDEAAVIAVLARIAPEHVVTPLAIEASRGWLLSPDQGKTFASLASMSTGQWEFLVAQYADLQRRTAPAEAALLTAGLPSLGPVDVPDHLHHLAEAFAQEPLGAPLHLEVALADRLHRAADGYRSVVAELDSGPIPLALEHNDLHHNNAFVPRAGEESLRFFDFGDALWAYPLTSVFVALGVVATEWRTTEDDPRLHRIVEAYLDGWTDLADPRTLRSQLRLARRLGPVHQLETWRRLLAHATPDEAAPWTHHPRAWLPQIRQILQYAGT